MKDANNKLIALRFKVKNITVWTALKWLLIVLVVLYVGSATGIKLAQDIKGLHVSYNLVINYSSNGILSPVGR